MTMSSADSKWFKCVSGYTLLINTKNTTLPPPVPFNFVGNMVTRWSVNNIFHSTTDKELRKLNGHTGSRSPIVQPQGGDQRLLELREMEA